ncbi:hypothetical protein BRYFOR_05826 [Marvinbryantia formatexigens DSM 14469]|uniref:Uncharacterized protein n=1 Tax=Marvinbryantia formatexigens DSM 14469 TaxID=478749 RepID=C6LB31_9FIRM|nr:hypothetical protein BRYFOR_05826 [Marvinbryantia formatexigens DSM 14469]
MTSEAREESRRLSEPLLVKKRKYTETQRTSLQEFPVFVGI